jgi:putative ABC transport system permease protein
MSRSQLPLRASVRFYRQHPLQLALTLLGIALGAAVIVAVALATRAAAVSFDRSLEALAGPMTHELRPREGALDEDLYRELRVEGGLRLSLPLIRVRLVLGDGTVELVGTDPLALVGNAEAPGAVGANLAALLTESNAVLAPASLAQRLGLAAGEYFEARNNERTIGLRLLAVSEAASGGWFGDVLLADIATVQHLSGRRGELDSIQLRLTVAEADALRLSLPAGLELRAYDDQRQTFDDMTRAFRTNLTAMSLLAVLVGAFLVYNAMAFAVVQRTPTFAILRMLGTTPRQLFTRLLLEASVLGFIGGVLGLLLGLALGQSLLLLVARTVSDLYVTIEATRPDLAPAQLLAALAVTLAAVLLATLAPALEAARTAPVSLERESTGQGTYGSVRLFLAGLGLAVACPLLIAVSGRSLVAGFAALSLLIAGYALLCPLLLRQLLRGLVSAVEGRGSTQLQLALRGVQSALPRTGPALIALTVAVSATVGVAIMIGSFRASVVSWLDGTLQGDLYVYLEAEGERLDPGWEGRLQALSGVQAVSVARQRRLRLDDELLRVLVLAETNANAGRFEILAGPVNAARRMLQDGTGLLISESLATRRQLSVGDTLTLTTPTGDIDQQVSGIYRDYASSYGAAIMPFAVYSAHWQDLTLSSLAVTLAPGVDAEALRQRITLLGARDGLDLTVVSSHAIRERTLAIFDRTFVITDVLRALVILVAFVGIFSALMALFLERRREFAVLRATGLTPRQLQGLVLAQAATGGLLAGLLALPLGGAMALLLVDVINRRSFGWTLAIHVDGAVVFEALLLAVAAAALAALWPARRLAGGDLRKALYSP